MVSQSFENGKTGTAHIKSAGRRIRIPFCRRSASSVKLPCSVAVLPALDGSALHVRLVLETLIAEHGAPLLLKKGNGSALNDEAANSLLARNGIVASCLPQPPRRIMAPAKPGTVQ